MLTVLEHPMITHKLSQMRRKETGTKDFRQILNEVAGLMAFEITRNLPMRDIDIETPVGPCHTRELARDIVLVPILRAGLGMVDGITNLIPTARVGHIGMYRDPDTLMPMTYFYKFPSGLPDSIVMVLDPMLATGGSASAAIREVKNHGAGAIRLVCVVGAPEGVECITRDHPDVDIYLAALDEKLNEHGYILPGLGDAGDRLFGTR